MLKEIKEAKTKKLVEFIKENKSSLSWLGAYYLYYYLVVNGYYYEKNRYFVEEINKEKELKGKQPILEFKDSEGNKKGVFKYEPMKTKLHIENEDIMELKEQIMFEITEKGPNLKIEDTEIPF